MDRIGPIVGSVLFFFVAPGTVAGLIPRWISRWDISRTPLPLLIAGGVLTTVSLAGLAACFARFAWEGRGTPAPVAPTKTLVVSGLYRHVRNPMYVAVLGAILGQAAMFASPGVLAWGAAAWLATHLFVLTYEEPTLKGAFPDQYAAYFAAVPRWIPQLTPWTPTFAQNPAPPTG